MTGTCVACLHTNQSRLYLNHPVYYSERWGKTYNYRKMILRDTSDGLGNWCGATISEYFPISDINISAVEIQAPLQHLISNYG
jgi:hypothetical protein